MATKYFCDRCNKEITIKPKCVSQLGDVGISPSRDFCKECFDYLLNEVQFRYPKANSKE